MNKIDELIGPTVAIILAFNEQLHIERAVVSALQLADYVYVIDAFSNDQTKILAEKAGAIVLQNIWTTHSGQFNWALTQLPSNTGWVIRIDADEYVDQQLVSQFHKAKYSTANGLTFNREIHFCGSRIHFGGVFPVAIVRAFRYGKGRCEARLMDEHIIVEGEIRSLKGLLVDQNLNSLTWWIDKHNRYASLEAAELLNVRHKFMRRQADDNNCSLGKSAKLKRWLKSTIYLRLPSASRARLYYFYRVYVRLGILGSREERRFHFLQGLWYRYLVDSKVHEVEQFIKNHKCGIVDAVLIKLNLNFKDE
jgi:glycosyltransferase involved in cell wall biosynthesis